MTIQAPLTKKGEIAFDYDDPWTLLVYSGVVVQALDGSYYMFYSAYGIDVDNDYGPALAVSPTPWGPWTRPIIGRITYPTVGGDTNNNLIIFRDNTPGSEIPMEFLDCIYAEGRYLAYVTQKVSGAHQLWEASDPTGAWTFVQNAFTTHNGNYAEGKAILYDGTTYKLFYRSIEVPGPELRNLGYYESATYNGVYVDQGLLPEFTATLTRQFYDMMTWEHRGIWWAAINIYNKVTEILGPLELWKSTDTGESWVQAGTLLELGNPGSFDSKLFAIGKPVLVGDVWYLIYVGSDQTHNFWPRREYFALAVGNSNDSIKGFACTPSGAILASLVAANYAEQAGDSYINGTRVDVNKVMYGTADAVDGSEVLINGIAHSSVGVRYLQTGDTTEKWPEGFATDSDGRQAYVTTVVSPSYSEGVARDSNGAMLVSIQ